jgi:hypothetical protein
MFSHQQKITPRTLLLNRKIAGVFWKKFCRVFRHLFYARPSRPALQFGPQRAKLLAGPNCIDLHAPIEQILCVTVHAQTRSHTLREKPVANALHAAGNIKPFCLK